MTRQIKKIVLGLSLLGALCWVAFLPQTGHCENLRFVFMADSPVGTIPPRPQPIDLINTPVLNAIINQILALSPRPSLVFYGGDMAAAGCFNGTYTFQTFREVMAPLTNAGIQLYTAVGNRELLKPPDVTKFYLANQQMYQQTFSDNPGNGPAGYEHLVYSFTSPGGDAFFAVLDPYYLTADVQNPNLTGTFDANQLNWLTTQLAQTRATHKFLFTHGPYYYVIDPSEEGGPPPGPSFTSLWQILDNHRFDAYFCGHIHLFSRKTIDRSILPDPQLTPPGQWHHNVVQVINGSAGAPIVTDPLTRDRALWHVYNDPDTYYFSVVDISGSRVTVTSYRGNTGAYTAFDSFTINKNAAAPWTDLLLLN